MMRMWIAAVVLAVPFLALADDRNPSDKAKADLKTLSGGWDAVGGAAMGKEIPKGDLPFRWTFKAGGKATFADQKRNTESTYAYTIDPAKTPKAIVLTYEGPVAALKGAVQLGIYKVEGDQLVLCLAFPGAAEKDRPKEFDTKVGKVMLMRFERAKAGK